MNPRAARAIGLGLALALAGAAALAILRDRAALQRTLDALSSSPAPALALAMALPLVSLALTALTFWLLTTRHGRVTPGEMFALIGAAWLLNYLPLWPGMLGRLAYHKKVNGIPVSRSAVTIVWANVLSALAALLTLGGALVSLAWASGDDGRLAALALLPAAGAGAMAAWAAARPPAPDPQVWKLLAALAVRLIELQVWAARYVVCFALIGAPIAWGGALALAGVTTLATLIPIGGNGLGLREWAVGLAAPMLPVALTLQTELSTHAGLSADLVNRAMEVLLAIPVGALCAWWIARRLRRASPLTPPGGPAPSP